MKLTAILFVLIPLCQIENAQTRTAPDYRKPAAAEWPLVGGDWGNTRYSTLAGINTSNVKTMKGAWMARLNSGFGPLYSQQGTPVVKDGVMYITTGEREIFALDERRQSAMGIPYATDPRTLDNKAKRGVALGEGKVLGVESDIRKPAACLGQAWSRSRACLRSMRRRGNYFGGTKLGEDIPKNLRQYVAAPPLYYKGLVYISVSGGDGGMRDGWVHTTLTAPKYGAGRRRRALRTGQRNVGGDSWKTGGGAMWVQPALDPDWVCSTSIPATRGPTTTAPRAAATTCLPAPSWRWTR